MKSKVAVVKPKSVTYGNTKKEELVTFDDIDTSIIKEVELPKIVGGQLEIVKQLDKKVSKAMNLANSAKYAAENAYSHSAGWRHRKATIESIQDAVLEISEATASNAESQKIMYDYMQKLGEITKNLFALGCSSIAMNRATVRELELKLSGASKEKLSELARKELQNVVVQLKQQEDIMSKQERLTENVKSNSKQIQNIANIAKENKFRLSEKDQIDAEQTRRLEELDAILENKNSVDEHQEEMIAKNADAIKILFEYTKQKDVLDAVQTKEIEALKKNRAGVALAFSIVALACSLATLVLTIAWHIL